ncbi:MAG TPA: Fe-S cluster assembly protein SufD, partial [Pseudolabrys sp.]
MNAEVRAIKTPAEQALSAAFAAARGKLPGSGVVTALRDEAFHRFDAHGLPHRRVEEWKYTDLRALMREAKPLAEPAARTGVVTGLVGVEAGQVAIVNGRYEPGWSNFNASDAGITLSELFAFAAEEKTYRLGDVPGKDDIAFWLNTAFMTGGVALRVKKNARQPVHIAHV